MVFFSFVFFALTSSVSLIGFYTEDEAISIETYSITRATVLVSVFFTCPSWGSDGSQRVFRVFNFISLFLTNAAKHAGFLLEARSRVPAPVYFEQSTRLLIVRN